MQLLQRFAPAAETEELLCAQVPLPPYGRKKPVHTFFLWTNQTCAWLHGDFPSLPLTATVLCPLPPPKGTLSPAQLVAVCFLNEHHGLPGLSASTPCCLPPVSQSPGMALVRQAAPAGPGEAGVGQGFVALC